MPQYFFQGKKKKDHTFTPWSFNNQIISAVPTLTFVQRQELVYPRVTAPVLLSCIRQIDFRQSRDVGV